MSFCRARPFLAGEPAAVGRQSWSDYLRISNTSTLPLLGI